MAVRRCLKLDIESKRVAMNDLETTFSESSEPVALIAPAADSHGFDLAPLTPDMYINRELSWLEFNRRVLEEVAEESTPLLERVKFAAIFVSNIDEFFMIRVAGVKRKIAAGMVEPGLDGRSPRQLLGEIQRTSQQLFAQHSRLLMDGLIPALAAEQIEILPWKKLSSQERKTVGEIFDREMYPVLTPQAVDRGRRFPHVSNDSLNQPVGHEICPGQDSGDAATPDSRGTGRGGVCRHRAGGIG
jgi:polyphosphate kinase